MQVAKNAKLAQLSSVSLYRIMLGVYATVGQDSDGIYCPSCFSTNIKKDEQREGGRSRNPYYTKCTCSQCKDSFPLAKLVSQSRQH